MRSPSLRSHVILGGIVAMSLSCSGGAGTTVDGPDDDPDPQPQNYPGVPAGTPVTVQISAAGGTVTTTDSAFSVAIPAGAVSKATDVTVRPLVSTAPNGFGVSYHIDPTGLKLAHPATITLKIDESALGGTPADWVGIGIRNTAGAWFGDIRSTASVSAATGARTNASARHAGTAASAPSDGRVVSVTTVQSSDGTWAEYSLIAFWTVLPSEATVEVSSSIPLRALACLKEVETNGSEIDSDALPALPQCKPSIRQATWRINGVVGATTASVSCPRERGTAPRPCISPRAASRVPIP